MRPRLLVPALLLISFPATGPAQVDRGVEGAKAFRAGAATSNITPPLGLPIVGNWESPPATFVHDELHARCLVLDDGRARLGFVICDNVGVSRPVFDAAAALVAAEVGLPQSHLLMASTHTHSATSARFEDPFAPGGSPTDYERFLARRIADGVRRAVHNLEPARIGRGSADVPGPVFNRRWFLRPGIPNPNPFGGLDRVRMNPGPLGDDLVEPAGPTDPQAYFISVRAKDGRPIALLAGYSLHYVGGVPEGHVSADYFAAFADRIAQGLGADRLDPPFVGILANGTSGDVNNIDVRHKAPAAPPYRKIREVADELAGAVLAAHRKVEFADWVPLAAARKELVLGVRKPTEAQVAAARAILARPEGVKPGHPRERAYAERVLQLQSAPGEVSVPLQAFRVGELGIAAIPFEVFAETGLAIKRKGLPRPTFTIELANGSYGYLPTPRQHALGGYETWMGTSKVEVEASEKIERAVLDLLESIGEKGRPGATPGG